MADIETGKQYCVTCGRVRGNRNFYASSNPLHKTGYIPHCKDCLRMALDDFSVGKVKDVLRMVDKPYIEDVWFSAQKEEGYIFGNYMKQLSLNYRNFTWADSRFEGMNQEGTVVSAVPTMSSYTKEEQMELIKKWGASFNHDLIVLFENKYQSLVSNYPVNTSLHEEALRTYCVYKVQAEEAVAAGNVDDAKKWGELAQKQGEIAKLNLNKLSKSDLSQGLDGFSELAKKVEEAVDIVPILPRFIEKPHDKIDFAILCYVNYMRKLEGKPEVSHSELYDFYSKSLEEHIENNPELEDYLEEVTISDGKGGKKKLKILSVDKQIKKLQEENPSDPFYKNLKKWVEIVSFMRFYPDLFFDTIRPETGGMRLDADQRMLIRGLARFRAVMGVFSRGYGKCVAKDTLIPTKKGIYEIEDFFSKNLKENDIIDMCIDITNRYGKSSISSKGLYSGIKPTKKITLEKDFFIETTFVHPLLVLEKNKEKWVKAKDLKIGQEVLLRSNFNISTKPIDERLLSYGVITLLKKGTVSKSILRANKEQIKKIADILQEQNIVFENIQNLRKAKTLFLSVGLILENKGLKFIGFSKASDSFSLKIKNISEGINKVYDIQVPETNSYIANGIINHNTMVQLMYNYHTAIWFPSTNLAMTAQTKENASALIGEKYNEIKRFFPLIVDELNGEPSIQKDKAIVDFIGLSRLDTLANNQSSKGARRHRITVEESAQVSQLLFEDVLEPVVNIPRKTLGSRTLINPYELNGQINRFTTSWYKNSSEYDKSLELKQDMIDLKGVFSLGAGWELPNAFGRGEIKSQIMSKKESLAPSSFAMNYSSEWIGVTNGSLVDISQVMNLRTLSKAELKAKKNGEYYIGVDVARSQSSANNQFSVAVVRVTRNTDQKINNIRLVNIINVPSTLNFKDQAIEVMRIKKVYNAKIVVVDGNGLGAGLIDQLILEQIDPFTSESLGCWRTINTDHESELKTAEEILYSIMAQKNNTEIIVNFMDMVNSGKLKLLEKRADTSKVVEDLDYLKNEVLPFYQTDMLVDELANLKLKTLAGGKLTVEQQTKAVDKDRYSALAYVLWYIKEFEDDYSNTSSSSDIEEFLLIN